MEPRVCLLVLGMHRSGTSALTRLLNIAGAKLPARMMGAAAGNELGHWEPQALADYNDALLADVSSAWHDWTQHSVERRSLNSHCMATFLPHWS